MIPFEEAFDIVMQSVRKTGSERVDFTSSLNRVLAEDVRSDLDMPPFDKSAMDGYACRREDLEGTLRVVEIIPAGQPPRKSIGQGECAKIMTGAMLPTGADWVIKIEETETVSDGEIRFRGGKSAKRNICFRAEDIQQGDIVLEKGTRIRPQEIALLATVGCTRPLVARAPRVGVIATGSELVDPGEVVRGSKIRNSNGFQLAAQAWSASAIVTNYGIAEDAEESLDAVMRKGLAENKLLIISGGVSVGDFDLVPEIMKRNGLDIRFDRVAIQPGKPLTFGVSEHTVCFGLPGNPVSTFVLFEVMVRPFLTAMTGCTAQPAETSFFLGKKIARKRTERRAFIPVVRIDSDTVVPVEYHGSAHIGSMCRADGLVSLPVGVSELQEGSMVHVRRFQ
ncbi:MAG: molybdopterin molybdotransferase MoeA [Candidatus Latescibacterota bacterium]